MQSQRFNTKPESTKPAELCNIEVDSVEPVTLSSMFSGDKGKDASIIATYAAGDCPIHFINEDGTIEQKDLRVMITCREYNGDGIYLLILSDHKIYITMSMYSKEVRWNQELGYELKELKAFVGDKANLVTKSDSLVSAINEIRQYALCSRRLVGTLKYVVENENQLPTFTDDMALCFRLDTKRFYYYSEAFNDWIVLPKGWAKLQYIVRNMEEVTELDAELYEKAGTLVDSIVYKLIDKENNTWIIDTINDVAGDEYMVQEIMAKNKYSAGSLLLTEKGWITIFNQ